MTDKEEVVYDIPALPRELRQPELDALLSMFEHPGWTVFIDLKRLDADGTRDAGMALDAEVSDWDKARGAYHGIKDVLAFETSVREGVSSE